MTSARKCWTASPPLWGPWIERQSDRRSPQPDSRADPIRPGARRGHRGGDPGPVRLHRRPTVEGPEHRLRLRPPRLRPGRPDGGLRHRRRGGHRRGRLLQAGTPPHTDRGARPSRCRAHPDRRRAGDARAGVGSLQADGFCAAGGGPGAYRRRPRPHRARSRSSGGRGQRESHPHRLPLGRTRAGDDPRDRALDGVSHHGPLVRDRALPDGRRRTHLPGRPDPLSRGDGRVFRPTCGAAGSGRRILAVRR